MRKRIISLVLAFCIVISLLVIPSSAADSDTPTVSGVWVFNESPVISSASFGYEAVNFISKEFCYGIEVKTSPGAQAGIYYDGPSGYYTIFRATSCTWDSGEEWRTVDFGDNEQTVTDNFYAWLTANATQQGAECTHTNTEIRNATDYYTGDTYCSDCDELLASGYNVISGWWQFNENIVAPLTAPLVKNTSFTCCGTNYESFGWTGTDVGIYYDDVKVYDNITGWTNNIYRTVNLGDALVPVSEDFLTWLSANAVNLSYADGVPLCIYDSDNSVLYPSFNVSYGSVLTVTDTGFTITDTAGVEESYPCAPGIAGVTFLGLSSSPDQTSAEYPVGKQIALTGATDLYVVLLELPIYAYLYSSDGQLLKILEALGDSTLTVNSNSLVLTGVDGVSDVYNLSLGSGETFLGLAAEPTQYYGVDWAVGQTISLSSSMDFYLVTEYSYPVILNFNNGVDLKIFTGSNSCVVCVNDTSIDFISHDGTIETLSIPMNTSDDYFYGLAVSPKQITVKYPVGSVISVYSSSEFYIVRQSDIKRLTAEEVTTEGDSDASFDPDDVRSLKSVISKLLDFFKSDFSISDFFGVLNDETQYAWFSVETAGQLDTTVTSVTFGLDEESDYEKYGMDTYYDHISRVYGDKGE